MKKHIFLLSIFILNMASALTLHSQINYNQYFTEERLRIDFILAGNREKQEAFLHKLAKECKWAGSPNSLIDPFRYGEYMFEAYAGSELIYSKGFSTLFQEWRTSAEAKKVSKAFTQTVWMPYPKDKIKIMLSERVKSTEKFRELFSCEIDPADKTINREIEKENLSTTLLQSGPMENKVDLVFLAEGYTRDEMDKFHKDCKTLADYMFSMEPYKERKSDFNIVAVDAVSEESGDDIPHHDIWKRTAMGSSFYTFYIDRYLTISDHDKIAANVSGIPFDAIFIIANDTKYGGGGIYNSYALGTSGNKLSREVFIHEFGHSFAGLADEYYDSEVAYEEFYNLRTEPWEPNITTLIDFDAKWKDMLDPHIPVPTPDSEEYNDVTGLFEGGGYMAKGIYRPVRNCRMNTNTAKGFCPVCRRAINRMIDFYVK